MTLQELLDEIMRLKEEIKRDGIGKLVDGNKLQSIKETFEVLKPFLDFDVLDSDNEMNIEIINKIKENLKADE